MVAALWQIRETLTILILKGCVPPSCLRTGWQVRHTENRTTTSWRALENSQFVRCANFLEHALLKKLSSNPPIREQNVPCIMGVNQWFRDQLLYIINSWLSNDRDSKLSIFDDPGAFVEGNSWKDPIIFIFINSQMRALTCCLFYSYLVQQLLLTGYWTYRWLQNIHYTLFKSWPVTSTSELLARTYKAPQPASFLTVLQLNVFQVWDLASHRYQ